MFQRHVNAEGCAEVVVCTCREKGLRVQIVEPDLQRPVRLLVTAASKEQFKQARALWCQRLMVSDKDGKITGASVSTRKSRSRL